MPVLSELESDLPPDQSPDALHEAALVEVHERFAEVFQAKVIGPSELLTFISTVGADTVAETLSAEPVPPETVH